MNRSWYCKPAAPVNSRFQVYSLYIVRETFIGFAGSIHVGEHHCMGASLGFHGDGFLQGLGLSTQREMVL